MTKKGCGGHNCLRDATMTICFPLFGLVGDFCTSCSERLIDRGLGVKEKEGPAVKTQAPTMSSSERVSKEKDEHV